MLTMPTFCDVNDIEILEDIFGYGWDKPYFVFDLKYYE
jgi:hypothetical protein